ncbi:MAG: Ig-like domain-containing protein, partial [Planctomycetota bacterium]|nr:Ig-like domain-containing protein [Planctomycetota bacterium]
MSRGNWLKDLRARLASSRMHRRAATRDRLRFRRPAVAAECLEARALLIAPFAVNDSYTVSYDSLTVAAAGVLANDYDYDMNYPLTAVLVTGPTNGSLTLNADGSFTYTPPLGHAGVESFTYKAKDSSNALSSAATVTLTVAKAFGARQNVDDLPQTGVQGYGDFAASSFTGDVSAAHEVAPGLALLYSAFAAAPKPVVAVEAFYSPTGSSPTSVTSTLTFNAATGTTVWYGAPSASGTLVRFAQQADATGLATGRYRWQMDVATNYSAGTATRVYTGYDHVVNRSGSEFGKGWMLSGLDRLVAQTGGVLHVGSD